MTSETNDEAQHSHLHRVQSLCVREAGGVHGAGVVFPEWQGRSPWLQKAINELVREVREQLIGLGKALRHEKLAAWGFHPPLETERFEVRLETGGQSATVKLLAVVMPALGRQMAFTPSIPEAWFEVLPGESVKTRLGEALSAYLKQQERESGSRSLDWSREVVAQLAKSGFDSRYGARPLQRASETHVVTPLAQLLMNQTVPIGSQIGLRLSGSGLIVAELS